MLVVFKSEDAYYDCQHIHRGSRILSREPNVIYVGRKLPMNYAMAIITGFNESNTKEITLKARGRSIVTAVDAVEIARHRFMKELSIGKITIGTEEMPPREGENRPRNVSMIEITLVLP
jgi:DNA-binding protein Alba